MRHVIEPYANYAYIPAPTVRPDRLRQFDAVDALDREHWIQFGVRNRLEVKEQGRPRDLADVDVYTTYSIVRELGTDPIQDIFLNAVVWPTTWFRIDVDGSYNLPASQIATLNTRLRLHDRDLWAVAFEHRYRVDENSLFSIDCTLLPEHPWSYNVYGRYEEQDNRLEEGGGFVQRNLDCMSVRTGVVVMPGYTTGAGVVEPEDWRLLVELWLVAFPDARVGSKYRQ